MVIHTFMSRESLAEVICESFRSQDSHETVATWNTVRCESLWNCLPCLPVADNLWNSYDLDGWKSSWPDLDVPMTSLVQQRPYVIVLLSQQAIQWPESRFLLRCSDCSHVVACVKVKKVTVTQDANHHVDYRERDDASATYVGTSPSHL